MPDNIINASSSNAATPAVLGASTDVTAGTQGVGVEGVSQFGPGVYGHSTKGRGVVAHSETDYGLRASSTSLSGIRSSSVSGTGIEGASGASGGIGIDGTCPNGIGVRGMSPQGLGISGLSDTGIGVSGESTQFEGVRGVAHNKDHGAVVGKHLGGGIAIYGESQNGVGVHGSSTTSEGVHADTQSTTTAALAAYQLNKDSTTAALYAKHVGNGVAAFFEGSIVVTGDLSMNHADCAEDFDIAAGSPAEPGTVMVLDGENTLRESSSSYDKRVAGVISGAGNYKPGIILDKQASNAGRRPVALLGKVFCKADARFGAIGIGDLLTTSTTPGHAMRATDPLQAFGAVIGKALRPLSEGRGLIPILIALQ